MKQKNNSNKAKTCEPILDFISGKTQTSAAKRLTKSIVSLQSLWKKEKMTGVVRKCSEDLKSFD